MSFSYILLPDDMRNAQLLKSDPLYRRLSDFQKKEAIEKAVRLGKVAALWVQQTFPGKDIREILRKMGIQLLEDRSNYSEILPFSLYRQKKATIILYVNVVKRLSNKLFRYSSLDDENILLERVIRIILYHELFHHMENIRYGSASKLIEIPIVIFGFIRFKSGIRALSEISAHTFAKECTGSIESFLGIRAKEVFESGL